jgi:phosphomannomutase
LGCELIHLNNRPTGEFTHAPEPTAQNLADLGPEIIKHGAAIGFAQDPDADRLAVIDEQGNYIGEEYTLALAAKYIFSKKTGTAAANLSTSRMIDDLAAQAGCSVIRTPVGEAHVANAMLKNDCIIGGEGNGGVIDLRVVPVRDSLVGIALILQLLAESGKTVSQLVAEIPRYHMLKTKFPCPQDQASAVLETVKRHYADAGPDGQTQIDTRDGIRIDLPAGWVQLRASNTEPIMRIMAESDNPQISQQLIEQIRQLAQV